jgi:hypothetical protein
MTTNAKIGIAVGVLIPVVFVVTLISQLPKGADQTQTPGGGEVGVPGEGLRAAFIDLHYDPDSERAALRHYQQYFEKGEHTASFWLSNPHPVPVKVTFAKTSCGACSFADLAVVHDPPADADQLARGFGAVAGGLLLPREVDEGEYRTRRAAEAGIPAGDWKRLKAANSTRPDVNGQPFVEVPPAKDGNPAWVVVRLNVNVTERKILEATLASQPEGVAVPTPMTLFASVVPVEPCEVAPTLVDFQEVEEGVGVLERTVYFFSATRPVGPAGTDGVLPPPDVSRIGGHLSFTPPVPAADDERATLARQVFADPERKVPKRVAGAYKMTLRFARTVRDGGKTAEADLGPFERTVSLVPQTATDGEGNVLRTPMTLETTPLVTVKAHLLGAVALEPGKNVKGDKIELGSFRTADGLDREVVVVSDRPGLELEGVPKECTPNYLKVEQELPAERKGDRTRWTVRLRIDPGLGGGPIPPGSVVVLRIKGTGQLVRIPVTGTGGG